MEVENDAVPPSETTEESNEKTDQKNAITILVKDQGGEETFFKVKKKTKMEKIFLAYAQRKGVQKSLLRFLLDGDRINPEDTPISLELEDMDQIDVVMEQSGGGYCKIEPSCELFFLALIVVSGTYLLLMSYVIVVGV